MCLNTIRIYLKALMGKNEDHPAARFLGIRDFLLGRYGSPPLKLK
jgi:hypothetical protein